MCDVCVERREGRKFTETTAFRIAEELSDLQTKYIDMACGKLDPHGDDAKKVAQLARIVIRRLVEDWI